MIRCTVGVFAHNEAHNVRRTLHALLAQQLQNVEMTEIIVIASGCTDATVELAEEVASSYPIVSVDVETTRRGKAAAIKRLTAMARGEIVVLVGADTLPAPTAIENLLAPFSDPQVGMTGARIIPLNSPNTWLGFSVQMLWHVHHQLALRRPKLGELVAFRNVVEIPEDTSTDEPAIEALITAKGYRTAYAPKAVVYNRGPENLREFLIQRRRVFAGQVNIAFRYHYLTSSLQMRHALPLIVEAIRSYPKFLPWTFGTMSLEVAARLMGMYDALRGRDDVVWRPAATSKAVVRAPQTSDLTLISVRWPPGSLDSARFLRELQRLPDPVGSVFWWDDNRGEVLLKLDAEDAPVEWIETQIETVSRDHVLRSPGLLGSPVVSCRLVRFMSAASPAAN
jgi:hypothetical protein